MTPQPPAALMPLMRNLDTLHPHPENVRRGHVELIAASLERYGQLKPVVALPDGRIVAGNHTFLAAQRLGWSQLAAVTVQLSDDEAQRYMLADNRSTDRAGYDDEALSRLLTALMEAGRLEGTGWAPDEVDDLIAAVGAVPTTAPEEFTGDYALTEEELAARFPDPDGHVPRTPVFLLYGREDAERFNRAVNNLRRAWGMRDSAATVLAALEAQPPAEGADALRDALARLEEQAEVSE